MNNRLYVGNLSFDTTEDEVRHTFARCGTVSEVKLVTDRETGNSRGFAFVSMASDREASGAIETMNGTDLGGRSLRVSIAEERKPRAAGSYGGGGERRW